MCHSGVDLQVQILPLVFCTAPPPLIPIGKMEDAFWLAVCQQVDLLIIHQEVNNDGAYHKFNQSLQWCKNSARVHSARVDNVIDLYDLCKLQDFELNRVVEWIHYFV